MNKNIIITGCSGFIGFHTSIHFLKKGYRVFGIDDMNNYYDIILKKKRLKQLKEKNSFKFYKLDISDFKKISKLKLPKNCTLINLAAQAGVRFSIKNPNEYFKSNIEGFYNILNLSLKLNVKHLIFASTSSVYGDSKKYPSRETDISDKPLNFYAASKKTNEVMAYSYSNIYNLPITCLRFFTVYGPFGRPDMSLYIFVKNIIENKAIDIFGHGKHTRDFTYIDDVIKYISKVFNKIPKSEKPPYRVLNIGNSDPKKLIDYVKIIEKKLKTQSKKKFYKRHKGEAFKTHASIKNIEKLTKYSPKTKVEEGIDKFIEWYLKE